MQVVDWLFTVTSIIFDSLWPCLFGLLFYNKKIVLKKLIFAVSICGIIGYILSKLNISLVILELEIPLYLYIWAIFVCIVIHLIFKTKYKTILLGLFLYAVIVVFVIIILSYFFDFFKVYYNISDNILNKVFWSVINSSFLLIYFIFKRILGITRVITVYSNDNKIDNIIILYGFSSNIIVSLLKISLELNKNSKIPVSVYILIFISFIMVFIILLLVLNFKKVNNSIYESCYMETLSSITTQLTSLKHNFDNILSSIVGYIEFKDWSGLNSFINLLKKKYVNGQLSNISMAQNIKIPALFGLIQNKLYKLNNLGISCHLIIENQVNSVEMNIVDLCECLGILIDNAIDAANKMENGYVKISISNNDNCVIFKIENSCEDNLELTRLFEKGWSSKGEGRGFGLWYLMNSIKEYSNVFLNTEVQNNVFCQELLILQSKSFRQSPHL